MVQSKKEVRLSKIAREFNVGISTLVDFLHNNGYDVDSNPNSKISSEIYEILVDAFRSKINTRDESQKMSQGKYKGKKGNISISDQEEEAKKAGDEETSDKSYNQEIKVVGRIDLDPINQLTRPPKKRAKQKEQDNEQQQKAEERKEENSKEYEGKYNQNREQQVIPDKSFKTWIETLPFPLASILWRYYAIDDKKDKIEHLFHFFEAFSEFLSTLILSAFVRDKTFYEQESHNWIEANEEYKKWYLNPSFGHWNILLSKLLKLIRRLLNNKEKAEVCKQLLGNPNDTFLLMLQNKDIIKILDDIRELRNVWKGHDGIKNMKEINNRLSILESSLTEFYTNIDKGFEDTRIISPTVNSYEKGTYKYKIYELTGVNTPFREVSFNSIIPLERYKIFVVHGKEEKPVELLPFIRFIEDSQAVYYYSRIKDNNIRWISYHYEPKPEFQEEPDDDFLQALNYLV